jgi:TolB protein
MNRTATMGQIFMCLFSVLHFNTVFSQETIGQFEAEGDIGHVLHPGSTIYTSADKNYLIAGSGENMWFGLDAFHFVWKKASGNIRIGADIKWIGNDGNPHRKACLIIRQDLEPDAVYADIAVHGVGLTSLQYRDSRGAETREIQSNVSAPQRVMLEKDGEYVFMSVAAEGEPLRSGGGSFRISIRDPFYVGLGVCAHDSNALEKAMFTNVEISPLPEEQEGEPVLESTLETISIASTDRRVIYTARKHFEAPNWSRDGKYILFNMDGLLYTLPVTGGEPKKLETGHAVHCNNDHGFSPDGTHIALSDHSMDGKSRISIIPSSGGSPRTVTARGPSYWHGWSPDGKTLAYCADRNGEFDIYTIGVEGGDESRLTSAPGLDDGPDYSSDGRFIYFNSERTGQMQIWRMKTDGSAQRQVTNDEYNNWFAHPSPDGKWIVFLSYEKNVRGHPANKDVMLRLMPAGGSETRVLARLFGGQGTINVPSWSPDSQNLAFVSYRLVHP